MERYHFDKKPPPVLAVGGIDVVGCNFTLDFIVLVVEGVAIIRRYPSTSLIQIALSNTPRRMVMVDDNRDMTHNRLSSSYLIVP